MLITLLVSALPIAYYEIESAAFSFPAVFNPCEPKVSCSLYEEVISHFFVWYLDIFVVVLI
jgi:hypothetical protein